MIVSFASQAASPGVTTLAATVGWAWPEDGSRRLLVEVDPAGGVLAARWNDAHGLTQEPGLIDLAAAQARSGWGDDRLDTTADPLDDVAQWLTPSFGVVPAPARPDQTAASTRALLERGIDHLAGDDDLVVLADCGRLSGSSAALGIAARSALTVLVCRPRLEEVQRLAALVAEIRASLPALGLVTIGDRPYDPIEIADHLAVPLVGVVADDDRWAESLRLDGFSSGRLAKSELLRSSAALAHRLAESARHAGVQAP